MKNLLEAKALPPLRNDLKGDTGSAQQGNANIHGSLPEDFVQLRTEVRSLGELD